MIEIKSINGSVLYSAECETLGEAVVAAIKAEANLRGANLYGSYLRGADLCGANLYGADLPDGFRIASLCFGGWGITITPTHTTIGCQTHPNADWLKWSPADVALMHDRAREWWERHRESVCAVIRDVIRDVMREEPTVLKGNEG